MPGTNGKYNDLPYTGVSVCTLTGQITELIWDFYNLVGLYIDGSNNIYGYFNIYEKYLTLKVSKITLCSTFKPHKIN